MFTHDIECLQNLFLVCLKEYKTGQKISFEISYRKNELSEMIAFYKQNKDKFFVSFNGINYDDCIINHIIKNEKKFLKLDNLEFTKQIREFSDKIIKSKEKIYYVSIYQRIDTLKHWTELSVKNKHISLKSAGVLLNHFTILELPYDLVVPDDKIDLMIFYCFNDVEITEKVFNKLKESYKLRFQFKKQYGDKIINLDDVNFGVHVLLTEYQKEFGELIVPNVNLNSVKGKDIIDDKIKFETKEFKTLHNYILNKSMDNFSYKLILPKYNLGISYGVGGIHSTNKPEFVKPKENEVFYTDDVASQYPRVLINRQVLGDLSKTFDKLRLDRVFHKKESKKYNKDSKEYLYHNGINETYKLAMNGSIGMLKNEYSPLYYPIGNRIITINGQLYLSAIAEQCLINGIRVDELNTDGINVILDKSKIETYNQIIAHYSKLFQLDFEREEYEYLVRTSVNDYFAKKTNSEFKYKGEFVVNPSFKLFQTNNHLIVPKSIINYFDNNESVKDFIKNHDNIFDFLISQKVSKEYEVFFLNEKVQRLNRYYASNKGGYLYKSKKSKSTFEHLLKDTGVMLFNEYEEKPMKDYNINYDFYIEKASSIIHKIIEKPSLF